MHHGVRRATTALAFVLAAGVAAAPSATGLGYAFTKVADTTTTMPSSAAAFTTLGDASIDQGRVAFIGASSDAGSLGNPGSLSGVYVYQSSQLAAVADTNDDAVTIEELAGTQLVTGKNRLFSPSHRPSLDGADLAYEATASFFLPPSGPPQPLAQLVTRTSGQPHSLATALTPAPADSTGIVAGTFDVLQQLAFDAGSTVFRGQTVDVSGFDARTGIYASFGGAPIQTIADDRTNFAPLLRPQVSNLFLQGFDDPDVSGDRIVFHATQIGVPPVARAEAVFLHDETSGVLDWVMRKGAGMKDTDGASNGRTFDTFAAPEVDGDHIAFFASDVSGFEGIYGNFGGTLGAVLSGALSATGLRALVDLDTPVPGGSGNFADIDPIFAISGDRFLFTGSDAGGTKGLYANLGGLLHEVLATGDLLDGKVVADVFISDEGLDGTSLVFRAVFSDASEGLFLASAVPEPPAGALLGLGPPTLFLAFRRRRSRRLPTW